MNKTVTSRCGYLDKYQTIKIHVKHRKTIKMFVSF